MIQVKINGNLYPATVAGRMRDKDWDGRESKAITMTGSYAEVSPLFTDGMAWSIVDEHTEPDETTGEDVTVQTEFDNSDFCVLGDITVHQNGTCTVKMGKETDEETLLTLLYGGEE